MYRLTNSRAGAELYGRKGSDDTRKPGVAEGGASSNAHAKDEGFTLKHNRCTTNECGNWGKRLVGEALLELLWFREAEGAGLQRMEPHLQVV